MIPGVSRAAVLRAAAALTLAGAAVAAPAVGKAAECGPGTIYDAPTNMCVLPPAAPAQWNAPPAPPPPPALPPISICPPIPFVPVCFPLN
ncbi:MAG: hypothetical protein FGM52_10455 [Mycobacterium sp.]|nr:hypothetical protein [Mycobacterium sp.]